MSETIKRNIQITYDTLNDLVNDTNLKPNMVVNTLGKERVSDGYGFTYKILAYEGANLTIKGPLIKGDKLVAKEIAGTNSTDDIDNLKKSISSLSAEIESAKSEEAQKETIDKAVKEVKALKEVTDKIEENPIVDTITALDVAGVEFNLLYNGQKSIFVSSLYGERFTMPEDPEPYTTATEVNKLIQKYLYDLNPPYTTSEAVAHILSQIENREDETLLKTEADIRLALEEYIESKKVPLEPDEPDPGEDPENPIDPDTPDPENPDPDNPGENTGGSGEEETEENSPNTSDNTGTGETGSENEETGETTGDLSSDTEEIPEALSLDETSEQTDITEEAVDTVDETGDGSETGNVTDTTDPENPDNPDLGEDPDEPIEDPPLTAVNTPGVSVNLNEDKTIATISFSTEEFQWVIPKHLYFQIMKFMNIKLLKVLHVDSINTLLLSILMLIVLGDLR